MSSIQERLQLKRVPLDTWNIREQLCLASAVVRSGDQNWMSVSRALKTIGEPNRPPDWYSQKSCAAQYGVLLENVETPKRKKRNSEGGVETPQESILKMLTQQRIQEIQNTLTEMNTQHEQLQNEIAEVRSNSTSDERIQELWASIEAAKRARERESARRAAWLKEREERRARAERTWRPPQTPPPVTGSTVQPSSPLLTSLLKSSPVVTTPQHIPHPASIVDAVSPSAGAPTLSLLLEQPGHAQDSKNAAIEHIKSQLVQIEHQLKASTSSPQPVSLTPTTPTPVPAVDIDDIEIKAEDVYAFRDIDIHIPPVTTMHKSPRLPEKAIFKKEETPPLPVPETPVIEPMDIDTIKEEAVQEESHPEVATTSVEPETIEEPPTQEETVSVVEETREPTPPPETEVRVPFPEVKFPTLEIKVIQPEDQKNKEEVKEPEVIQPVVEVKEEIVPVEETTESTTEPAEQEPEAEPILDPRDIPLPEPEEPPPAEEQDPADIPLPIDDLPAPSQDVEETAKGSNSAVPSPKPHDDDNQEETIEKIEAEINRIETAMPEEVKTEEQSVENVLEDTKKEEDAEVRRILQDSIPLKEMLNETPAVPQEEVKTERVEEDTHTETDDDTPMELSREEEKDGKKKRDYSRKKKPDSRTCSGSESAPEAEASAPDSPAAADDRQHRLWKKSVMLVYSRLCAHKYASLFLRPISDDEAPGYSVVVKRPMDLTTIRRNIDAGVVRTTAEFQRDVLLMLANALLYNSSEHSVHAMAKEMHEEAAAQLGMLLAAQAHAGLCAEPPRRKRRLHRDRPT